MEKEKGKTYKYLRDKREVPQEVKDNLKRYNSIKKSITNALKEEDLTIDQLSQKISTPKDEVVFFVMSMLKYGIIEKGSLDDMDEYFTYKLKT